MIRLIENVGINNIVSVLNIADESVKNDLYDFEYDGYVFVIQSEYDDVYDESTDAETAIYDLHEMGCGYYISVRDDYTEVGCYTYEDVFEDANSGSIYD